MKGRHPTVPDDRTADAPLEATWELFGDDLIGGITLADLAARSRSDESDGVDRIGDNDVVLAAMFTKMSAEVGERRGHQPPSPAAQIQLKISKGLSTELRGKSNYVDN